MKKGQAAVEYFTTYGWAVLVLIIVIALLVGSGIFSPNYLVSEECNFGTNLQCNFALFNEGGTTKLALSIRNAFPYKIKIKDMAIQTQEGDRAFSFPGFTGDLEIQSGENATFEGVLDGTELPENTIKRLSGSITYVSCAPEINETACSTLEHTITGRIVAQVMPG